MHAAVRLLLAPMDDHAGQHMLPCCMQGRFSGRLQSKSDEAGLLEECSQLGPLLGGSLDPEVRDAPLACLLHAVHTRMHACDQCSAGKVAHMVLHLSRQYQHSTSWP
jgi:hypothetical protein